MNCFSWINLISVLIHCKYFKYNTLLAKHYHKAECLRATSLSLSIYLSLSKLDITVKNVLNSLKNDRCSFIFITLLMQTTTPIISTKIFFQLISTSQFRPYLSIKPFLQFSLTLSSSIPQHFFIPFSCIQRSLQSESKVPSLPQPFSQFRLRQGTSEQSSLVRTDTVLISLFFLKV